MTTTTTDQTFTLPACPAWCNQPPATPTSTPPPRGTRPAATGATAPRRGPRGSRRSRARPDRHRWAWVTIVADNGDQLTPAEARALASELVRAASAIDQG
jgi:hypothetical protein